MLVKDYTSNIFFLILLQKSTEEIEDKSDFVFVLGLWRDSTEEEQSLRNLVLDSFAGSRVPTPLEAKRIEKSIQVLRVTLSFLYWEMDAGCLLQRVTAIWCIKSIRNGRTTDYQCTQPFIIQVMEIVGSG